MGARPLSPRRQARSDPCTRPGSPRRSGDGAGIPGAHHARARRKHAGQAPAPPLAAGERCAGDGTGARLRHLAGPALDGPAGALDLSPAQPKTEFARTGPLERTPALAYESTRYDGAWIPTGNLTHVVARRSIIAGAILGALGALREECTEKDRANYKRECVPDAYEYRPSKE
jgi:hypothetical protein